MLSPRYSPLDSLFQDNRAVVKDTRFTQTDHRRPSLPVDLNFEELPLYESVHNHYWGCGVRFEGAIAITPSNPAFSAPPGAIALMPTARRFHLAACFREPCQQVGLLLTGARQIRVTAYTANHQVLLRQCTPLGRSQPSTQAGDSWPQRFVWLNAERIARVVIASDSPFIISRFTFGASLP